MFINKIVKFNVKKIFKNCFIYIGMYNIYILFIWMFRVSCIMKIMIRFG